MDEMAIRRKVRELVSTHTGADLRNRGDTTVLQELGLDGDDAAELIEAYAAQLSVDMTGFDFHRHFQPEGGGCLFFLPELLLGRGRTGDEPLSIGDLVDAAVRGRWSP
jgi:hypothetical protein